MSDVQPAELNVVEQPLDDEHDVHEPVVHAEHSPLHRWSQHTLVVADVDTQKPERQSPSTAHAKPFDVTQRPLVLHTLFVPHDDGTVMQTSATESEVDVAEPGTHWLVSTHVASHVASDTRVLGVPLELVPHSDTSDAVAQMPAVVQRDEPELPHRSHELPFQPATTLLQGMVAEHTAAIPELKQPSAFAHWLVHEPDPLHDLQTVDAVLPAHDEPDEQQYLFESNGDAFASHVDNKQRAPLQF